LRASAVNILGRQYGWLILIQAGIALAVASWMLIAAGA
jgi:hypothetical protein